MAASAMSGHWSNRIFRTHLPIPNVGFRLQAAVPLETCSALTAASVAHGEKP